MAKEQGNEFEEKAVRERMFNVILKAQDMGGLMEAARFPYEEFSLDAPLEVVRSYEARYNSRRPPHLTDAELHQIFEMGRRATPYKVAGKFREK